MKAIVAVDKKWGIGKDNDLLFSIPEDMKFFRETTKGKVVVMGANTLKSFPNEKPLPNRVNIVLSTKLRRDDCVVLDSVDKVLEKIKEYPANDVYLIGGASVYRLFLPYCTHALVTKVDADGGATAFFDNLDELKEWACEEVSDTISTNGYDIKFTTYKNLNIKK